MKTKKKYVRIPVIAGMQFGTTNYKMRKIGYDLFEHTYLLHDDGDEQLISTRKVKRVINY
jgi:hypothetical protein